jgi:hypothetical protein
VVTVKAEPKKGWHDTSGDFSYTSMGEKSGMGKQFETVDYGAVDEIVVWVEPATAEPAEVPNITIDAAAPKKALQVAPPGAVWFVQHASGGVYLRCEDGRVMNLGSSNRPTVSGYVEVIVDPKPDPIARIFIPPTRYAQVALSGRKITFDNLPPGAAKVACWHPRLPGSQNSVTLEAGKTAHATVTVGVNSLPKVP